MKRLPTARNSWLIIPCWAILFALAMPQNARAQKEVDELVVMIRAKWPSDERIGAGVIVGSALGRVYVVTALHVVSETSDASDVSVEFNFIPAETFPAEVLAPRSDELDLAVLKIEVDDEVLAYIDGWEYDHFRAARGLVSGYEVHKIGYAEGRPWFRDLRPDFLSALSGDTLEIQSQNVVPGYSGGVFIDGDERIIALIRRVTDDLTTATPVEVVFGELEQWRFDVPWQISTSPTVPDRSSGPEPATTDQHLENSFRELRGFPRDGDPTTRLLIELNIRDGMKNHLSKLGLDSGPSDDMDLLRLEQLARDLGVIR